MSRAALQFQRALERQAEQAGKTSSEFLSIKAATLGLGDSTIKLIQSVHGAGDALASTGAKGVSAFTGIARSADGATTEASARLQTLIQKIREVNTQAANLKVQAVGQNQAGQLSDDGLKVKLANINAVREANINELKAVSDQQAVIERTAAADVAANERRKASTQALIDKLNGVPEAYRKQVAALQESLVKGDITPKQFQTSVLQATSQRPDIQKAKAEQAAAAAEIIASEKKIAAEAQASSAARVEAARKIIDAQKGLLPGYREELKALRDLRDAGALTQEQFRKAGADLVTRQPIVNADPALIARIRQASAGIGQFGAAAAQAAAKTKLTNYEIQTLNFTVSDVIASLASGISPMTILLQQGGQVRDVFQGFGPFFTKIGALFTPFRIAVGGAIAALGVLGLAFFKGEKDSKAFADALVLTGNFAGQTAGSFEAMVKQIAASGQVSIGNAREFGLAIAATGEVGALNFKIASEAAARFGAATGKNAKEVAADFASMGRDAASWAGSHNRSLNFITAAQFLHVKALQEQGRSVEAQGIIYEALNVRLKDLEANLTGIDRILRKASVEWSKFWNAAAGLVGGTETVEDRIQKLQSKIAFSAPDATSALFKAMVFGKPEKNPAKDLENQAAVILASREKVRQDDNAAAQADRAAVTQSVIAFEAVLDGLKAKAKAKTVLDLKLLELEQGFRNRAEIGRAVSEKDKQLFRAQTIKDFSPTPDRSAESEAEALRKAILARNLQTAQQHFTREQDALKFNQQELQAIYQAGTISLKAFYDAKEALTIEGIDGELRALKVKQTELDNELSKRGLKAPARVDLEKQRDAVVEESRRVKEKADRAAIIGTHEYEAAQKALNDRIVEFSANLKQLAGDEAGAAKLRADQAIAAAQALAKASANQPGAEDLPAQVRRFSDLTTAARLFADAQREVGLETSRARRAEDLFLLRAEQSGKSLIETEQGLTAIRQKSLEVLRERLAVQQANAGTDPAKLEAVAQRAAQIEIEADRADESLNRLRESVKSFADSVAENIGNALTNFKGVKPFLESIQKDLLRETTKLLVTEPLKVEFRAVFKGLSEGDGQFAGFFKTLVGGGTTSSGVAGATVTQTAAVTASTTAMTTLTAAATAAASALATMASSSGISGAIGGGGGFGTGVNFGNVDYGAYFHSGGIVGSGGEMRAVPRGTWAHAARYRTGGMAGLRPDEVPAVLHRNEEVIRRDDPRHRLNSGGQAPVIVNVNQSFAANTDRRTVAQAASDAGMQVRRSMARNT